MPKFQMTTQIDEKILEELKKTRDETGLPISRLINLKIKGYKVVRE